MKKRTIYILAFSLVFAFSCKKQAKEDKEVQEKNTTTTETTETVNEKKLKMELQPKSGSNVKGNIVFTEKNGEVKMIAMIENLEPGQHAIHIHEKADCSAEDGTSTGGHWNPTAQPHGKWGDAAGYHKGDIGNLTANEKGMAYLEFKTDEWCLGCGDKNKDIIGKSIIVHAAVDDFVSQPTGNAGGRISCGGIIQ
ncbi:superoxide dismutase family protein [Oceanihabitans sediminis]|uniref:superoxide dismutase family protein n=1 Tax=Oceanihabitans sediminis TaxID=1812012 RepID=UPI003A8F6880